MLACMAIPDGALSPTKELTYSAGDCEYDTIEECTPAVLTGNRGYCAMNPYWRPAPDQK
jgi:hypothetical protein